jgi:hypothetical protein
MEGVLENIGLGALSSIFIAGVGYFKGLSPEGKLQEFDPIKFCSTVILGGIVGGTAGATGMTTDVIVSLPMYAGITVFVENILKAIKRKFFG